MRKLVWRNLLRNKRRTAFTLVSMAVGVLLLSALLSVLKLLTESSEGGENRVVVRSAISLTFSLPEAYWRRLETLDHVEAVTPLDWFGGIYIDTRPQNFFAQFASDPATLNLVYPDFEMPPGQREAWANERTAFVAGRSLAERHGWNIGDRITLKGEIYPFDLELTLRGLFTYEEDEGVERQIFFHRDYFTESVEAAFGSAGTVGTYFLKVDSPENVPAVIEAAEAMFANSTAQVKAETESAFELSFTEMLGNVTLLFGAIGLAVVISIFFIIANTMAMAARERSTEMAVLKTLGFRNRQILGLVTVESAFLGLLGGALGVLLSMALVSGARQAMLEYFPFFGSLRVAPETALTGLLVALGLGLLSGFLPGLAQARRSIVEGLRRVA